MEKHDLRVVPSESGVLDFDVYGSSEDSGLMLLQRLYTLLFTLHSEDAYVRNDAQALSLLDFTTGANKQLAGVADPIISICCQDAVSQLDEDDRSRISSFTGYMEGDVIHLVLVLGNGTTVRGRIANE